MVRPKASTDLYVSRSRHPESEVSSVLTVTFCGWPKSMQSATTVAVPPATVSVISVTSATDLGSLSTYWSANSPGVKPPAYISSAIGRVGESMGPGVTVPMYWNFHAPSSAPLVAGASDAPAERSSSSSSSLASARCTYESFDTSVSLALASAVAAAASACSHFSACSFTLVSCSSRARAVAPSSAASASGLRRASSLARCAAAAALAAARASASTSASALPPAA
mmetsp:Transcript_13067/g.54736  ORF Transcript_13067/g.54736 Transcript_13067/m.54736 type:complete len:225 (-) Transcript_13067:503-1177(-)